MKIEVIETIGRVRTTLFGNVLEALKACGVNGKVVLVHDLKTILKYGVKSTPALIVNGMVMFAGKTLPPDKIMKFLQQHHSTFS